ncbi:MAG TPA: acetate--CoA ligase family protein [Streptosporangiaceae bacterium]|jgi:acyl-CoA synthetase (NDP forming)
MPPQPPAAGQAAASVRDQVRSLVTPARLAEFFAPQSLALVGASEASGWARFIALACSTAGYTGPVYPVHPKVDSAFGHKAFRNLRDIGQPVDHAFILAPTHAVESVIDDMAAAGIRNATVLAAGYREVGPDGRALEQKLIAQCAAAGIVILGPNCLGFLNTHAHTAPFALGVPPPLTAGPVGVALQSGALATVVLQYAKAHAIGVSSLTTVGNEAMITIEDMIEYLVEDDNTKVVALFLEEISDPVKFAHAAARADAAGKPIVALKVGSSEAGQAAALAHTGSVAGDDAVVNSVLSQLNILRVNSIEELLNTAALLGYDRVPAGRRMGVITASGGACDIIADRSSEQGITIPPFAPATADAITPHLPSFATAHNPLDVTGVGLAGARTGTLTAIDYALDAAVDDPGLDFVLFSGVNIPDAPPPDASLAKVMEDRLEWLSQRMASSPIPVIPVGSTSVDTGAWARELLGKHHVHVLGGLDFGIKALGNAILWQERRGSVRQSLPQPKVPHGVVLEGAQPWSEAKGRDLLSQAGVPVVPGEVVSSAAEAVAAAQRLGTPVAMKIVSAQITHKSDIGGVALGLSSEAEITAAFEKVQAAGGSVAGATVDGVLVTPMRGGGLELLAGVAIDPTFGPVLAVGLGGVWVEIMKDTSLRVLPADAAEVKRMLAELRGFPLLRGARGSQAVDLDVLAEAIAGIGATALSLGGALRAFEVNPLWVNGDQVEALDVLIATGPDVESGTELSA